MPGSDSGPNCFQALGSSPGLLHTLLQGPTECPGEEVCVCYGLYKGCVYYFSTYYKAVRRTRSFKCVFITAVPLIKLFAWGEGESGGHVLRETTSRGRCGLVCPSRTSERGGEGDCVKEGGGGERERERERALGRLLCHSRRN